MNHSSHKEFPGLVSNKVLGREQPLIRKQTTIGANKIRLILPQACFFEDDCIEGTLQLDLKTRISAKKITLQFIGEMSYVLEEQPDSPDGFNQNSNAPLGDLITQWKLPSDSENKTLRRSYTQGGRLVSSGTPQQKITTQLTDRFSPNSDRAMLKRSISGTFSRSKKFSQAMSIMRSVSKVYPIFRQPTHPNTDVFCHYSVPLYTFKEKCPPGRYNMPFSFEFDDLVLPTTNFSRENLKLFIKYLVIAEVEVDGEDVDSCNEESDLDSEDEDYRPKRLFFDRKGNMKCQVVIEILWNYALHIRESSLYTRNEVEKQRDITIPRYFCSCFSYTANAILKISKTIITLGDKVPFSLQLSNSERNLTLSIEANLIEEVTNQIAGVSETNIIKLKVTTNLIRPSANCIILEGEIDFESSTNVCSLISNEWNISHSLEFKTTIKKFLDIKAEKIVVACLIVPNLTSKQIRRMTGEKAEGRSSFLDESTDDDDVLQLPYCKFKLGKRFDVVKERSSNHLLD